MKKNKMMRVASVLLVAVLLTTSIISGTFAKYVTSGEAGDQARVAKFGVTITGSGSLFAQTYFEKDQGNTPGNKADEPNTTLTVESSNADKVVAPGTKNDTGLSLAASGAPEVDVKITLAIDDNSQDIYLKQGAYPNRTTAALKDLFANDADYYPIVYTLKCGANVLKSGKLSEIKDYLKTYSQYVDANTTMTGDAYTYTLTWAWDFDASGAGTYDKQDTLLGDIAAFRNGLVCNFENLGEGDGVILEQGVHYSVDTNVKISLTVTQVD